MKRAEQRSTGRERPGDWESWVDRIIRSALESGAFDDLPGAGKPLNLAHNPHTPRQWQLAFHILENAGYRPAWIEQRAAIEAALADARAACKRSLEHADGEAEKQAAIEGFQAQLEAINKQIDRLNLAVPVPAFQRPHLRIDRELETLDPSP
jgi:hypothetical protein